VDAPAVVTITQGKHHVLRFMNRQAKLIWPLLEPGRSLRELDPRSEGIQRRDQAYQRGEQVVSHDVCIEFD